ncbi:MAG: deoxyribonuclease IV [Deltaproteobacteria bacterium]|nr:deoxyribonuclease IV [Deltaproteobacteria bacterium]
MPLGVHTSIAGGLCKSIERAVLLGCSAMQIFGRNPRSWIYKPLPPEEARLFRSTREASGLWPVVVHTNYLINLCSPDEEIFSKSIDIFSKEFSIAGQIGADYLVTHLGSPRDMGPRFAIQRAAQAFKEVARAGLGLKTMVLIENTSGAGSGFGGSLRDLGEVIRAAQEDGVASGLCLDTCHAFAAGYSFSTPAEVRALVEEIDEAVGMENLKLIHLNDSKGALASKLDRHEHIGGGRIGIEAFRALLAHPGIMKVPMILETPKNTQDDDPRNLAIVRGLLEVSS